MTEDLTQAIRQHQQGQEQDGQNRPTGQPQYAQ